MFFVVNKCFTLLIKNGAKDNIKGPLETYRNWANVVAIDWLRWVQVPIPTGAIPTSIIPTSTIPTVLIPTCHYPWQNSMHMLKSNLA